MTSVYLDVWVPDNDLAKNYHKVSTNVKSFDNNFSAILKKQNKTKQNKTKQNKTITKTSW